MLSLVSKNKYICIFYVFEFQIPPIDYLKTCRILVGPIK